MDRLYYQDNDWATKLQEKYWLARQKFLSKVERKEDSCIILSDSKLDAKLGIYRSIDKSCGRLTEILENYQNALFVLSNEENSLGVLLKECGKHDRTKAGKIMAITGKSLTQASHQRIKLYMPLMRMYQEMETFHTRAVEDTASTVDELESKRAQYRASLLWMKDVSEKLDPDVYKQLDKFRKIQAKVRDDKKTFDNIQMDVVQKIDLLMASRCNLLNQVLAPYQTILLETFEKNFNNFNSVEEIIKKEDIYEYEFQSLKHLNPLRLNLDEPAPQTSNKNDDSNINDNNNNNKEEKLVDLMQVDDDQHAGDQDRRITESISDNLFELESADTSPSSSSVRRIADLTNLIEEPKDTLELLSSLFNNKGDVDETAQTSGKQPTIDELLSYEMDQIDNNSNFKSLQGLNI